MADPSHPWLTKFVESGHIRALAEASQRELRTVARGSRGSSTALLAGALAVRTSKMVLLVVAHLDEADDALDDLELFNDVGYELSVERFGALEVLPGESNVSLELLAERMGVVDRLLKGDWPSVIVAPVQALMQSIPPPEAMDRLGLTLERGVEMGQGNLLAWLDRAGYERQDAIEQPGDFAVRGGIVDIFTPAGSFQDEQAQHVGKTSEAVVRIDFFGDEIESIHWVDPDTLGSRQALLSARIIGADVSALQNDDGAISLFEMLPDHTLPILHEAMELSEQARGYYERLTNSEGVFSPKSIFAQLVERNHLEVNQYSTTRQGDQMLELPIDPSFNFDTDTRKAIDELIELASASDQQVIVLCQKPAERDRLLELLNEHTHHAQHHVILEVGYLHRGFVWEHGDLHLITHHELFHRYDTRRRVRQITTSSGTNASGGGAFVDMEMDDYVVHVDHGIARFLGLKTLRRKDETQEYLTLQFADKVLLHVPITQIDLVQKYIGGFHGVPPLSKMGGKKWGKQKQQVQEAVRDLAKELLRVQAARATQPGVAYPEDTPWQKEFEAEFPYDETEDQLSAIAAIKNDMAKTQSMDRLICGDVGFGKTEVAIRGAFKVAESGRQVAILVPTTILAEQHERTFRQRMADYPFRIESLSRFKTPVEQAALLEDLAAGRIDMVIGTHRLLSKDVKFADLGMVIIDEEQRFGVEHKNKLLQLRLTAEILTLTATPIPRTLHMSMVGLRDISSLVTPPADRRAIVTEVIAYDEQRIKQAMIRELNREGQIYFVHNRVHNIQSVADDLRKLVPDARIIVGHGQMPSRMLEQVMLTFMSGKADILVSTTIIESGLDIPTANTMFINHADHFGLADLHQLRGRVGRYKHRAYCYLLLPKDRPVAEQAIKRLQAIEQYTMLGAGFKIAMRDLEIRGAGNLLGAEQSGHIAAVGYEMYCLLLEQEAKRLQNQPLVDASRTHLELPVKGQLPKRYIASDKHRMDVHRRLARCHTLDELKEVVADMTDAYGDPPPPAKLLLDLTQLRLAASMHGIESIQLEGSDLIFRSRNASNLQSIFEGAAGRVSVLDEQTLYYRPPPNYLESSQTLLTVLRKRLIGSLAHEESIA